MENPNASWDEMLTYGALAVGTAPLALVDMMGEAFLNAGNAAGRTGQLLARADFTTDTDTKVVSRLAAVSEAANAFTGLAGPFAGVGAPTAPLTVEQRALQGFQGAEATAQARATYGLTVGGGATETTVANWGTGPLRAPARALLENEGVLIDASHGLQSRTSGLFNEVQLGQHGEAATKYLYTVDRRGVNVVLEQTPFPTPRGNVVHTNISSKASIGGEVWFGPSNSVTINAGSGRFGDAAGITTQQWEATAKLWESLGYKVNPVPYGKR